MTFKHMFAVVFNHEYFIFTGAEKDKICLNKCVNLLNRKKHLRFVVNYSNAKLVDMSYTVKYSRYRSYLADL